MDKEPERFSWELYPFRIDSFGNWVVFGYPILGGWLPYLAFKSSVELIDVGDGEVKSTMQYVIAEWFIRGYMVVYKVKEEYIGE